MKLLLIDDDKPSLKALSATLEMLGFDSEAFNNPAEAVARFQRKNDFDLVITDLRMPAMSGMEVMRSVRACDSVIPIVVITAYKDHAQLQADRIFYKPVNIRSLVKYLNLFKSREGFSTDKLADENR